MGQNAIEDRASAQAAIIRALLPWLPSFEQFAATRLPLPAPSPAPKAKVINLFATTRRSSTREGAAIGWVRHARAAAGDVSATFRARAGSIGSIKVSVSFKTPGALCFSSDDDLPDGATLLIEIYHGEDEVITVRAPARSLAEGVLVQVPFQPRRDSWEFRLGLEL